MNNAININELKRHFKVDEDTIFRILKRFSDKHKVKALHKHENSIYTSQEYFDMIINEENAVANELIPIDDIINSASDKMSINSTNIIYFLINSNELVYIGQTTKALSRIGEHQYNSDKIFNKIFYIDVPQHKLDQVEMSYIITYNPPKNITGTEAHTKLEFLVDRVLERVKSEGDM